MDISEKLVELIGGTPCVGFSSRAAVEHVANWLVQNDVTVQEWISVKDRLPEEEGLYLVAVVNDHERRYSKTAWYHGHGNWFVHQKVTHWQYLPQPPKGE